MTQWPWSHWNICLPFVCSTSTETAAAVLTPPSWPLASWLDGNLHDVQGRQDVNEKKKKKRVAKTGREIHCWKTLTLGIHWNLGLHSAVTNNESRSGDESQANVHDEGMENIAALSRHLYAVTVDTGISILINYIISKGILLRSVGCILMELLFSPSAPPPHPPLPHPFLEYTFFIQQQNRCKMGPGCRRSALLNCLSWTYGQ